MILNNNNNINNNNNNNNHNSNEKNTSIKSSQITKINNPRFINNKENEKCVKMELNFDSGRK